MSVDTTDEPSNGRGEEPPVAALWQRIESWLAAHAPEARAALRPAVTAEAVEQVERTLGAELPQDFRESLRIHDGQTSFPVFARWKLLSCSSILERWKLQLRISRELGLESTPGRPEGPVRGVWWDALWVPIATDGAGNDLCLDLHPPAAGKRGQLIEYVHDDEGRPVVSTSFRAWLRGFVDDLEAGRYDVDDFSGFPVEKA